MHPACHLIPTSTLQPSQLQRRRQLEGERRRMLERLLEDEQERRASLSALQGGAPPSSRARPVSRPPLALARRLLGRPCCAWG